MKKFLSIHKAPLLYIAVTVGLASLLLLLAKNVSGFGEFYSAKVFPFFPNTLGRLFSPVPFSVFEIGLYLLALLLVCCLAACLGGLFTCRGRTALRRLFPRGLLAFGCFGASILLLLTLNCSINYSRNGFAADAGLVVTASSRESLVQLCELLIADLSALSPQIEADDDGTFSLEASFGAETEKAALSQAAKEAKEAMVQLGRRYPTLSGYYPNPKPVLLSCRMSDLALTGIFSPYTVEANYNTDVSDYLIPYTICHELAHLKGYIRENEAGFIGYLACAESDVPELRYSAAVSALSYALTALYGDSSQEEYQVVLRQVPAQALYDLQCNQAYWQQHRGKVYQAARTANDVYLKANGQAGGLKSYGRMVDLLLAYYNLGAEAL